MPTGKPSEQPNLIRSRIDNGYSIDADQVGSAYGRLGHLSQNVIVPNFGLTTSRDLGYYRETEAIFNVIRDNEKIMIN